MGVALAFVALFGAADAVAAGEKDAEATKLYDAAMNDDYLNVELAKAEKKLQDAIKKCGTDGCTPKVLAKVQIGLGVIHFANNKLDLAKEAFVAGLKVDPTAALDPTFKGAEIDKIFDDAKKSTGAAGAGGASGGSSGGGGASGGAGGAGGSGPAKVGGDLKHNPPAEQQVNTAVPIYIEVPADMGIKKVTLRYKPFGSTEWKPLEMGKVGDGWGVELKCTEVTTTGDLKYYITADDDAGTVATAGSRSEPYKVSIKNDIEGDPPSLPGKKPPKQCAGTSDCVPGFPRCPGAECSSAADCNEGLYCSADGKCAKRSLECKAWGASCVDNSECCDGYSCSDGTCQEGGGGTASPSKKKGKQFFVSVSASLNLLLISGRDLVCSGKDASGNVSDGSYVCFHSDGGGQFYGVPNDAGGTNGITGGFGVGGATFSAGFDWNLMQTFNVPNINLTAGLRVGFGLSAFPTSTADPTEAQRGFGHSKANEFKPFNIEGRGQYSFLGNFVEKGKFRPYAFVGGGAGQVNAGVPVTVCDTVDKDGDPVPQSKSCGKQAGSVETNVDAYQITGLGYVAFGPGVTYGFTDWFGLQLEVKVMLMVPTFGVVIAPTLSPVVAF